jgi:eukaryotic-like serine/threonine-protein kinase
MPAPLACPEIERWQALTGDTIPPDQLKQYERHLESCPACQEQIDQAEEDVHALLTLARQVGDPAAVTADPILKETMERLYEVKSPLRNVSAEPPDLYFLRPGNRLDILGMLGNYEVEEVIGQGGMGVVLKAFEPALHRLVAIKVMAAAVAGSAVARQRFTREAKAAAAVCHDHIVTVHGVHEMDGLPYLVMQYVAGESLQARLDRAGPLEVVELVRIGLQTASGLAAAHAQGLIHRDIKPANLLLENGLARVRITDFGLARMIDDVPLTRSGELAGTPEYMAPEQARGEAVDHRVDLFSLGSVLYALCTGVPPFRGSSAVAVLRQVSDLTPAPIRSLNPDTPAWLETFIARLMAKDPSERFQSAAEVAALLEGYLAHLRQPTAIPAPELPSTAANGSHVPAVPELPTATFEWSLSPLQLLGLALMAALGIGLITLGFTKAIARMNPGATATNESAPSVRRLHGHTGPVHNVRFTSDGQRLVSASGWPHGDRTVRVWDLKTCQERNRIALPGEIHSLDLTADGHFALAGLNTGQVLHLDLERGQVVGTLSIHGAAVGWVAFAPDGERAFSTSDDGTAKMWNLVDGQGLTQVRVLSNQARGGVLLLNGGRLLTGDSAGVLQIWDTATGQEFKRISMNGLWMIDALSLTPDGRQALVACVAGVRLYDLETGQEVRHFQEETEEVHQADLSRDGHYLIAGSFDGKVRLWDFQNGELLRVLGSHNGFVFSVAFSPDGRLAASGGGGRGEGNSFLPGDDHDIRLWEIYIPPAEASAAPQAGSKGWLVATELLGLVFTISILIVLGVWLYGRQHRHAAQLPAHAATPDQPPELEAPPISLACFACGKNLKVKAELAGKKVKCSQCGKAVLVPEIKPDAAIRLSK